MDRLYFGVTGVPSDARRPTSEAGVERVKELGLEAMELAWVRGVKMGGASAQRLSEVAREHGIRLSAHAAYYINLNAEDEALRTRSRERLLPRRGPLNPRLNQPPAARRLRRTTSWDAP